MTENSAINPLPPMGPDALKAQLKKPLDPQALANDDLALRSLANMLNDPNQQFDLSAIKTGEYPGPEKAGEYSGPSGPGGTTQFADPIPEAPAPVPIPTPVPAPAAQSAPLRLVFTGKPGVGRRWLAQQLGAQVVDLFDGFRDLAKTCFDTDEGVPDVFYQAVQAWGDGLVSDKWPLIPTRALFVDLARRKFEANFGTSGFWLGRALGLAQQASGQAIVIGVTSEEQFKRLTGAGFVHFHVLCSNATYATRTKRPGEDVTFANALDNNVMQQISRQRNGERLRCIWNDNQPPPSGRFFDLGAALQRLRATAEISL